MNLARYGVAEAPSKRASCWLMRADIALEFGDQEGKAGDLN